MRPEIPGLRWCGSCNQTRRADNLGVVTGSEGTVISGDLQRAPASHVPFSMRGALAARAHGILQLDPHSVAWSLLRDKV